MHRMRSLIACVAALLVVAACTPAAPASTTSGPTTAAAAAKPTAAPAAAASPSAPSSAASAAAAAASPAAKPAASPVAAASPSPASSPAPAAKPAAAPAQAPAGPATHILVSSAPGSPNDQPIWVAKESGIMQRNGIDMEWLFAPAAQGLAALLSNQVDITMTGGAEALGGIAGGGDLVILANIVPVIPWQFYAGPSIQTPADLKGKKIGITQPGASYDTAMRIVLPKMGIDPDKDVTLIPTGSIINVSTALYNGAIDAAPQVVTPASFKVVSQGNFHELFDFAKWAGPYGGDLVVVRRDYLAKNHDLVQKYIDSLVQGIARFKADRAYAIQVAQKYLEEPDQALVAKTYDYFVQNVTPSAPYATADQMTELLAALATRNERAKSIQLDKVLDPSLVKSAVDRGLDKAQ